LILIIYTEITDRFSLDQYNFLFNNYELQSNLE